MPGTAKPRPIVILGPTAGGKSQLAVDLALALGGQVIGADSMQVYRHMDAGTAKPSPTMRRQVPHHLIDIVEPTERFTVANWSTQADALITKLQGDGICPIIVGGTNLYIKVLLEGMFDGPATDPELRQALEAVPRTQLHDRLRAVDPEAAQRIHPNDQKRLVRALEVYHATGKTISEQQTQWDQPPANVTSRQASAVKASRQASAVKASRQASVVKASQAASDVKESAPSQAHSGETPFYRHDPILVGLDWPVDAINRRINLRVKAMFYPHKMTDEALAKLAIDADTGETQSLPDEVAGLHRQGLLGTQAREALGYKQVLEHLEGRCSLDEAYEKTKILTRRFAKTQRTWLRRFRSVAWLEAPDCQPGELLDKIMDIVNC